MSQRIRSRATPVPADSGRRSPAKPDLGAGRWYWAPGNDHPHFYGEDLVAVCGHDTVAGPLRTDLAGADGFYGDTDCPVCVAIVRRAAGMLAAEPDR